MPSAKARRMYLRALVAGGTTAALVAAAAPAAAQPSPAAEATFQEGKRLMERRQYAAACEAFAASDRLEPSVAAKMKLADCYEQSGKLASAWTAWLAVAKVTRDDGARQAEHQVAASRARALESRLPYLTVSVPAASQVEGLVITRNGAVIDAVIWNRAVPVDGGTHTIVARAPGREPWSTVVTIDGDGATRTVDVPRFEVLPVAMDDDEGGPPPSPHRSYLVPGVVAATAVVLGGVAVGLDVSARGRYDDAASSRDPDARAELYDSAVARRRAAIGLGVGAVAAAGVAGWLWWRERSRVVITPTDGGVAVAWRGSL